MGLCRLGGRIICPKLHEQSQAVRTLLVHLLRQPPGLREGLGGIASPPKAPASLSRLSSGEMQLWLTPEPSLKCTHPPCLRHLLPGTQLWGIAAKARVQVGPSLHLSGPGRVGESLARWA